MALSDAARVPVSLSAFADGALASRQSGQTSLAVTFCNKQNGQMDDATISAYDRDARFFADDWDAQPPPVDLHAVVGQFFIPGLTADIGCGSGRDAAWLNARGYAIYPPARHLAVKVRLFIDFLVERFSAGLEAGIGRSSAMDA